MKSASSLWWRRWTPGRALAMAALCVFAAATAQAQPSGDASVERRRIAEQKAEGRALFEQEQRECQSRFAVTACVEQARRGHRETMASLARQSALLDDVERRQRAALRAQAIRDRVSAEAARQQQTTAPARAVRTAPSAQRSAAPAEGSATLAPARVRESDAQRAAREARNRATFDARQAETQAHREAVQRRIDERQKSHSAAAPLPKPSEPNR